MIFNLNRFITNLPFLLQGMIFTIVLSVSALCVGLIIGTIMGMARLSKSKGVRYPATAYVEFIRGTPMIVQLFFLYFGFSAILNIPAIPSAIIALGCNSGAYVAEIVRAGIQSIDRGQTEAARSLGMTPWQTMELVILPQAFRRILPPLGNEFIVLIKDSSLASMLAIEEMFRKAILIAASTYDYFTMYLGVAVLYFILTYAASNLVGFVERKVRLP